ncbi:MAG: ankyrin repeat domain-containing protein, partial [Longimicrobiales bacterium]
MSRKLTPDSTLENLKREAKRWLHALRGGDAEARARLERTHPEAPAEPTLRDVQHALAREHGLSGWTALKREVEALALRRGGSARERAIQELLLAASRGDTGRVVALLDERPDIVNEPALLAGHSGLRSALHHAAAHADTVATLLERGADPNIRDEGDDAMPLHFAAERGDMEVVRLLIEHGADPVGEGTVHELNVLGWAVCWDYAHQAEVARYLLDHGARHTIHTAVAMGEV